jgi:hypothetical protein
VAVTEFAPVDGLPEGAKLRELYDRLYVGTERGEIEWEFRSDGRFRLEVKSGAVEVTHMGVIVFDGSGAEHSRFAWPQARPSGAGVGYVGEVLEMPMVPVRRDGTLYDILIRAHRLEVEVVIARILGDLA